MAAKALSPAEAELVSSLTEDDIPTKLRCAICSKLAVNAFKLPCCEQLIDETCHSTLPSTCPVCEHTPLSAADCNPNKVMRSTIRVFIKTELKKRETTRAKQTKEAAPLAPATPVEAAAVTAAAVLSTTAAVTGDMAAANANAMEEAQQQQGMMGSSTTFEQKTHNNKCKKVATMQVQGRKDLKDLKTLKATAAAAAAATKKTTTTTTTTTSTTITATAAAATTTTMAALPLL
ncbi:MAG: hypothetical protein STHCBS139747_007211 [Sporothrix thermara]